MGVVVLEGRGQGVLLARHGGDASGQRFIRLVQANDAGLNALLVADDDAHVGVQLLLIGQHGFTQPGLVSGEGRQIGGRSLRGVLDLRHLASQRLLACPQSVCLGVEASMACDDGFMKLPLVALNGLDACGDPLGLRVEVLDAFPEFGGPGVDLRGEGGKLPGIRGHHGLQFDLIVLHPGQLLAATADEKQGPSDCAQTDAQPGPSFDFESLRFSHGDSFPSS